MPATRTCIDDRGKRVRVPSPLHERAWLSETPRGTRLLQARETLFATPSWNIYRWPVAIAAVMLVWFLISGLEWLVNFNDSPIGRFLVRFPVSLFAGFAVFRTLPRTDPALASVRDDISEARYCIACTFDLRTQTEADDNCTVCPRCGCAVRLSRLNAERSM